MYNKILVPLDGSELAECALPHVEGIAKLFGAEVDLVRVIPHMHATYMVEITDEIMAKEEEEVDRYLNKIAKEMEAKGIKVEKCVHRGHPAEEIIKHTETRDCDLIIIASHGRSGLGRWTHGSTADKVFTHSHAPVLMVRPPIDSS